MRLFPECQRTFCRTNRGQFEKASARVPWIAGILILWTSLGAHAGSPDTSMPHMTTRFFNKSGNPEKGIALSFSNSGNAAAVSTTAGKTVFMRTKDCEPYAARTFVAGTLRYSQDNQSVIMIRGDKAFVVKGGQAAAIPVTLAPPATGNVGITLTQKGGKTIVASVKPGGSAEGRLLNGDEIVAVGQDSRGRPNSILGRSADEVAKLIAGPAGSRVELKVIPRGKEVPVSIVVARMTEGSSGSNIATALNREPLAWIMNNGRFDMLNSATGQTVTTIWPDQIRHAKQAAMSPDSKLFALAGSTNKYDLAIEVYDIATQKVKALLPLRESGCYDLRFTADSKNIVTLSAQRVLHIDPESRQIIAAFNHEGTVESDSSGENYTSAGNQFRRVFDIQQFGGGFKWVPVKANPSNTERIYHYLDGVRELTCVATSSTGVIAIGTGKSEVHLLDLQTGAPLMQLGSKEDHEVQLLDFSPDGRWLAYYSNGTFHMYDIGEKVASFQKDGKVDQFESQPGSSAVKLTSALGGFDATFPTKPKYDPSTHRYSAKIEESGAVCEVLWMDFGDKLVEKAKKPDEIREIYDTFGKSFSRLMNGKVTQANDATVDSRTERLIEVNFTKDNVDWVANFRVFAHGTKLYVANVSYPQSKPMDTDQLKAFQSSLSVR